MDFLQECIECIHQFHDLSCSFFRPPLTGHAHEVSKESRYLSNGVLSENVEWLNTSRNSAAALPGLIAGCYDVSALKAGLSAACKSASTVYGLTQPNKTEFVSAAQTRCTANSERERPIRTVR